MAAELPMSPNAPIIIGVAQPDSPSVALPCDLCPPSDADLAVRYVVVSLGDISVSVGLCAGHVATVQHMISDPAFAKAQLDALSAEVERRKVVPLGAGRRRR